MNRLLPFEWIAAVRFLYEGRVQTTLIVLGVAIGVSVIVFMSALLTGLQANIIRRTLTAQAPIVVLPREEVARPLRGADRRPADPDGALQIAQVQAQAQRLRSIDQWQAVVERARRMPGVVAVSPVAAGPAFAVRGDASRPVTIYGVEPEHHFRIVLVGEKIVAGALGITSQDILIGTELAHDLGVTLGDKIRLATAAGQAETLKVAGIFDLGNKGANQRNVYIALRTAQPLLDLAGGVSDIEIGIVDAFAADDTARTLAAITGLQVDSWITTNAQFFVAINAQSLSSVIIRLSVALSVAFGIASVLVVSVVQRSRDIGILRAMGTSRGQVLRIFLIQGGIVGLAGSVLGAALGAGFVMLWRAAALNSDGTPMFALDISPALFASTAVIATVVGVLAAVAPALRAARLDPVVAIRG
ncbi:MAG: ABC transporter permease [Rhodospirillales bacterium]|nr:MAG: ABC transporter permease [Rhodospirillales bacterium]